MPALTAHHVSKRFGASEVLRDVSFTIGRGERVALVGVNGSGKSTLGRILAGGDEPDAGTVARRRDIECVYLAQEPVLDLTRTVYDEVESALGRWRDTIQRYEKLSELLLSSPAETHKLIDEQTTLAADIEQLGGWDPRHKILSVLGHLGIQRPQQVVGEMSGGERRRVALAKVLVAKPGLAILDEPTNHLDADTAEWLETYLREEFAGALLLITHDRYFLDRLVTRIVEIDRGEAVSYDGAYRAWVVQKTERLALESRTESRRLNLLRREQDWLSRGPAARSTKQKARIERAGDLADVVARDKRSGREVSLLAAAVRPGKREIELKKVSKSYGDKVLFKDLDLILQPGERVGVVGPNGAGKTTLIRVILGEEQPDSGEVIRGPSSKAVYFDQSRAALIDEASILVNVAGDADKVRVGERWMDARGYLERFLFDPSRLGQPVGSLSGGERARVALAKILLEEASVLVLDEPTNDLDLATLSALEEMLCDWPGTAIIVSHDRWFLNRVATGILAFEGNGRVLFQPGDWDTWRTLRDESVRQQEALRATVASSTVNPRKQAQEKPAGARTLTMAEQKELTALPDRIDATEREIQTVESQLNDPMIYADRSDAVPALLTAATTLRATLDALMARWEELESRREAMARR
jgi:ABC transport system ATP-binding/permease protein